MQELELQYEGKNSIHQAPENWKEITVDLYSKLSLIETEGKTDIEKSIESLSILTGIKEELFYEMPTTAFKQIAEIVSFTNEKVPSSDKDCIDIEGDKYYLKKDFDNLKMGEVISLEIIMDRSDGNISKMMPEMLCIFLRKKDENGELEDFKKDFMDRAELFRHVSIVDVNDLFVFFSDGGEKFTANMKASLQNQQTKEKMKSLKIDLKS